MIKWLRRGEAAVVLDVSPRKIRSWGESGRLPVKYVDNKKYYGVEVEEQEADVQEFFEKADDKYFFDERQDVYFFFGLPDQPPVVRVPRGRIDALIRDYSNESGGATINQLSITYEMSRATVKGILSTLGKTHDSSPFSDETLRIKSEDELTRSLLRAKEQRVLVKAQKKRLTSLEGKLNTADLVKHYVDEVFSALPEHPLNSPRQYESREDLSYACVLGLTDLHIGKRGVDGYNSDVAAERARYTITQGSGFALDCWGTPDCWILTCGSDMLHVDNYQGTTQKGTPMDTDTDPVEMVAIAYRLMEEMTLMLLETAPVKIVSMTGNHDRLLSAMLGMMLAARFTSEEHVEVIDGSTGSAYIRYGNALLGFNHGDSVRPEKLPLLMSGDRPQDWGECSGNWDWFCGHLHALILRVQEINGCRVWTMPALSGTDRWHKLNGYSMNRKQLAMFRVEPDRGVAAVELIAAKD